MYQYFGRVDGFTSPSPPSTILSRQRVHSHLVLPLFYGRSSYSLTIITFSVRVYCLVSTVRPSVSLGGLRFSHSIMDVDFFDGMSRVRSASPRPLLSSVLSFFPRSRAGTGPPSIFLPVSEEHDITFTSWIQILLRGPLTPFLSKSKAALRSVPPLSLLAVFFPPRSPTLILIQDFYLRQITGPRAKHKENTETTSLQFLKGAGWR